MGETAFKRKILKQLREHGAIIFHAVGNRYAEAGWPDECVITQSNIYWLEFKGISTPLRDLQYAMIRKINRIRCGTAYVVREPAAVQYIFPNGHVIIRPFDGTGGGLLETLLKGFVLDEKQTEQTEQIVMDRDDS